MSWKAIAASLGRILSCLILILIGLVLLVLVWVFLL